MSWDQFCQDAKRLANQAAKKINQTADLASLQVKLRIATEKLEEAYAELGRVTYLHFSDGGNYTQTIAKAMERVKTEKEAVSKLQMQIKECKDAQKAESCNQTEQDSRFEAEQKSSKETPSEDA